MNSICVQSVPSVAKPRKIVVPLAVGLAWDADPEYIYQEKMDGVFAKEEVRMQNAETGAVIVGERMPSGKFFAFDCLTYNDQDLRDSPLWERLLYLDSVFNSSFFILPSTFARVRTAEHGGQLLETVLTEGGEGVVRKPRAGKWGTPMEACKRLETFVCVVTGINAGQSARIARVISPESSVFSPNLKTVDCGSVSLFGGKIDRIRVGSILKIEGFGLTRAGSIREPRPCKDSPTSWLIQY